MQSNIVLKKFFSTRKFFLQKFHNTDLRYTLLIIHNIINAGVHTNALLLIKVVDIAKRAGASERALFIKTSPTTTWKTVTFINICQEVMRLE